MNGFEAHFWFCFRLVQVEEAHWESAWWKFELYCSPLTQVTGHKNLKMGKFVANSGLKSVAEDQLKTGFEAEILKFRDYARTRVKFSKTSRICQNWTQEAIIWETEVTGCRAGHWRILARRVLAQRAWMYLPAWTREVLVLQEMLADLHSHLKSQRLIEHFNFCLVNRYLQFLHCINVDG